MSRDAATQAQVEAADPGNSTWVSANAGSGKTRVLTDRVARLLLRGTDPQAILCLTYTKAAAAEMQTRLFERLGAWAMLPEADLRARIDALGEPAPESLALARTLFARALETPGGLKIQTIHAFCEQILRRFPLEAGVQPGFEVLDDRQAAQIRADLLQRIAEDPEGELAEAAPHLLSQETDFDALLQAVLTHREAFTTAPDLPDYLSALGVPPKAPDLAAQIRDAVPAADLAALMTAQAASPNKGDPKFVPALQAMVEDQPGYQDALQSVYLTKAGQIVKALATNPVIDAFPPAAEIQTTIADLVLAFRLDRLARETAIASTRFAAFAGRFVTDYAAIKTRLGRLDFDDLIDAARHLLARSEARDWVRYRLDGGISHILVDEAQDTSPAQWQVIDALTEELRAGAGAGPRTVFVVGDFKQSIYSFQGADPASFATQRDRYRDALRDVGQALADCSLDHSFRSAAPVLDVVDAALAVHDDHGLGADIRHLAHQSDLPGRVELWPLEEGTEAEEPAVWYDPVDQLPASDPSRAVAASIADHVKRLLAQNPILPGRNDPLTPGDILILVQTRNKFFRETIAALKAAGVPVAGADRLKVAEQLAVKDILSLLKFLALREDDLSLAEALRSPLCGLSERDLFRLAHGRTGPLRAALMRSEAHADLADMLRDLERRADFDRPYDLIDRVLVHYGARPRIRARLGAEADEAVDALVDLALDYERVEPPTLTGFLDWMGTGDPELKRQLDPRGGEVRVMTVHGAKGLEAPVVILPDTAKHQSRQGPPLTPVAPGLVALRPKQPDQPARVLTELAERDRRAAEENWRLLYVAMTRAEQWLIVCGGGTEKDAEAGWYGRIRAAMEHLGAETDEKGRRVHQKGWTAPAPGDGSGDTSPEPAPDWLTGRPPVRPRPLPPLVPSRQTADDGEIAPSGDGPPPEVALRRGRQIHRLLEHLATCDPADRADCARALLSSGEDAAAPGEAEDLLAEAASVLDHPGFAWIFTPDSRAEVPVAGRLDALAGRGVAGIIDRLVVTPEAVWAIDFKTDHNPPDTTAAIPPTYAAQLALYVTALAQVYPGKAVRGALLWTRTQALMEVPPDAIARALDSVSAH